jgi:hypothetical protein
MIFTIAGAITLIDVNEPHSRKAPVASDQFHLLFGSGQAEVRIELPSRKHTLHPVLDDARHYPFGPPIVSEN